MLKLKIGNKVVAQFAREFCKKGDIFTIRQIKPCLSQGDESLSSCTNCPGYVNVGIEEGCNCYGFVEGYLFKKIKVTWRGKVQ